MSIARFTKSDFNLTDDPIIEGFKSAHAATTQELIESFLRDGTEQALILFEERFREDKVWIPEEHRYKIYNKFIPEIEAPVRELIEKLEKKYLQDPKSLLPREIALLGKAYEFGVVVERNTVKAHHMYLDVAETCPLVAVDLGVAFYYGKEAFMQDQARGLKYFEWARDQGVAIASTALAFIHQSYAMQATQKQITSTNPNDPEALAAIQKDYLIARNYFAAAAKKSEPQALYHLGIAYLSGTGVVAHEMNESESLRLLQISAIKGSPAALSVLGLVEATKEKHPQTKKKSPSYFALAAEFGDHEANSLLGTLHFAPQRLHDQARVCYENSDEFKNSLSELGLYHYFNDRGDSTKAVVYMRKAFENGNGKRVIDELSEMLCLQRLLPSNKRCPTIAYHSAMALRDEKYHQPGIKKLLTEFAQAQPDKFEELSKWESWATLQPVLEEKTAKAVHDKKHESLEKMISGIGEGAPTLFRPLKEIVVSYVADMHPSYLEEFFQATRPKPA